MTQNNSHKFCVAPMMGYTTPHARYLYRLLSNRAFLFTEMVASKTIINSVKKNKFLKKDILENPIAFQIGGSDPIELSQCCEIIEEAGFDEINLNIGCPSKTVQKGMFGACLMKEKELVKKCLIRMKRSTTLDVSIKCRLGVDEFDSYNFFKEFIESVIESNISTIYVHARKAILKGLSPKGNRTVPQLKYEYVYRIKEEFPNIKFILNGGINSIEQAKNLCGNFDGVMLGRLIQSNPLVLREVDEIFYTNSSTNIKLGNILQNYFYYIRSNLNDESIYKLFSPILGVFFGISNSKQIKKMIHKHLQKQNIEKLQEIFITQIA